jgi:hypothetical protein
LHSVRNQTRDVILSEFAAADESKDLLLPLPLQLPLPLLLPLLFFLSFP